jgi:TonB family protein
MIAAHLWQSTIVALCAAVLAWTLQRSSARTRHAIWLVASVKFLVPLSMFAIAGQVAGGWISSITPLPGADALRWLDRSISLWRFESTAAMVASPDWQQTTVAVLALVWLVVASGLAARRIAEWRRLSALVGTSRPLTKEREADALRRALVRQPEAERVTLVEHHSPTEPGVFGITRPRLVWPAGLSARLSDSELDAIVAHEICHVRRRDNLAAAVHAIVETVFWFHPMVWWIGARLVDERERACDEEVLEMGTDNRSYAEGIVKVCGFCLRAPAAFVAGVGGASLAQRIEAILSSRAPSVRSWTRAIPLGLVVASAGVPMIAACARTTQVAGQPNVYTPGKDVTTPVLVHEVKPNYTREAMQAKIQGGIKLEAIVLKDGTVGDVKVLQSLDTVHGLDEEAIKTMKQWRFKPGTKDNKPVDVQVEVEMTFTLK